MNTSGKPDRDIDGFQRIAGAFFHDFNNLFQTALGNLDLLARRVDDPATAELVDEAILSVERAVALTGRLNLIGNKYPERFERVEIDPAIEAAVRDMREQTGARRKLTFRGGAAGASCDLPPGQLESALSTLISEGPAGLSRGPVTIKTEVCENAAPPEDLAPGNYVRITISGSAGTPPSSPPGLPVMDAGVGFLILRLFAAQLGGACRMDPNADGCVRVDLFLPGADG